MGASLTVIDRHYGHLARDGREHAIQLLDALNAGFEPWTLVDAAWTSEPHSAVRTATETAAGQAISESPLTDSNRRPPPYHRGQARVITTTKAPQARRI
jgi:hypothetical protein